MRNRSDKVLKFATVLLFFFALWHNTSAQNTNMTKAQLEKKWKNTNQEGTALRNKNKLNEAISCFNKNLALLYSEGAQYSKYHICTLRELGLTYFENGDVVNELKIRDSLLEIEKHIRSKTPRHVDYLIQLSLYFISIRHKDLPELFVEQAFEIANELNNDSLIASVLNEKALCLFLNQKFQEALSAQRQCTEYSNEFNSEYAKSLLFYQYINEDWAGIDSTLQHVFEELRENVLRQFNHSRSSDRHVFWNQSNSFFIDWLPRIVSTHPSPVVCSNAYNSLLFSKSILLAADVKTSSMVLNSNNSELIGAYYRFLELNDIQQRTTNEDFELISLSEVIAKYLVTDKKGFREDFRVEWEAVREALPPHGIAIEFFTFFNKLGEKRYGALSVKKESSHPKLTLLQGLEQLEGIPTDSIYNNSLWYNAVWGAFQEDFVGIEQVYFSPTDVFFNIGIEYLPNQEGINFCALYDVFRLSSTKQIVKKKTCKFKKGIMFGGVEYDAIDSTANSIQSKQDSSVDRSIVIEELRDRLIRGSRNANNFGFGYLPGTKKEVEEISKIFNDSGIRNDLMTGVKASEDSFKSLSGLDFDIIHIATHGFCNISSTDQSNRSIEEIFVSRKTESRPLLSVEKELSSDNLRHSGLILAGANKIFNSSNPDQQHTGILFADEIANLDLGMADLVVISACQSGLGEINMSEGVFGLQRGFKLAGANSIIMSLWKVDDEATCVLMTSFYRNLVSGKSKKESLWNAQLELRSVSDGKYDSPMYWAAFIILDAFE